MRCQIKINFLINFGYLNYVHINNYNFNFIVSSILFFNRLEKLTWPWFIFTSSKSVTGYITLSFNKNLKK